MATATRPQASALTRAAGPRQPQPGDTDVMFDGLSAQILDVYPDGSVDLIYSDSGRRRIADRIRRGLGPGLWAFAADAEAVRPRTPMELVAEAKARGERVPEIGALVSYGFHVLASPIANYSIIEVEPRRARITAVYGLDDVALEVYEADLPEDLEEPERVTKVVLTCKRATALPPAVALQGCKDSWDWPGGLIKRFGPVNLQDLFPRHQCTRCGLGVNLVTNVFLGDPKPQQIGLSVVGLSTKPDAVLCDDCTRAARSALAPLLVDAPEPATA